MTAPFHCLVLTEDSGQKSFDVVEAVARKVLRLLGEGAAIDLVEVEPGDERARRAMGFNGYRSTKPRDDHRRIDIAAAIVTQLLREDMPRFVIMHVDGDRRWSERGRAPGPICELQGLFERNIVRRVREGLRQKGRPELLERLLYMIPFWSIEAWLYQNSTELQKIYSEDPRRHERDAELLAAWREDPSGLDEVERPKARAMTFQDGYNQRLARTFPGRKVYELGQSFTYSVDEFRRCEPLFVALQALKYTAG
ncbi:MAG TPA: hypothetical protein VGB85_19035 [Nannocystis sp.]